MGSTVRKAIHIGLFTGLVALSGCGGGGSDSSTAPAATTRPIATNNLRVYQSGDFIQYDVTASISVGGVTLETFTGTMSYTVTLQAGPIDPTGVLRSLATLNTNLVSSKGTPSNSVTSSYFQQDAAANMNYYGNSTDGWVTTPTSGFYTGLKSPLTAPSSWAGSHTNQNGTSTNYTTTVVGKEVIATGAGSFDAYKVIDSETSVDISRVSSSLTSTQHVVPSIGPVKMIEASSSNTVNGFQTITVTATMSTTNIPF